MRDALAPKKKFAFSKKTNAGKGTAEQTTVKEDVRLPASIGQMQKCVDTLIGVRKLRIHGL